MKKIILFAIAAVIFSASVSAQTKPKPKAAAAPKTTTAAVKFEKGTVDGTTFTNKFFGMKFDVPENWQVQEEIVNKIIKDAGTKSVKAKNNPTQKALDQAAARVTVALTALKNPMGSAENASVVLSFENMNSTPVVKDAVDYMDLMVNTFKSVQLPAGMTYSAVQAEKLGARQFAYLDVKRPEVKQRMYVTMKKGYAILFVFTYTDAADLETMRTMLANANFAVK